MKNTIASLLLLLLMSASAHAVDVVGKWRTAKSGEIWEFAKDGSFSTTLRPDPTGKTISFPSGGKYSVLSEDRIKVEISGFGVTIVYKAVLDGSILTLTDSSGIPISLSRVK